MNQRALAAEAIGTFMLVASILGAALFSFAAPAGAAGILGAAFSIGLTVMAMAYAVGHISGGHFNPAITIGLVAAGKFDAAKVVPYIIAQCIGAILAAAIFATLIATSINVGNMASNGYGSASMVKAGLVSVFTIEVLLTAFFVLVVVGSTSKRAPAGFAPIAIGLTLTVIHLVSIPVSNTSVNPARSLGPAIFGGTLALQQLWVFIVAPIIGGVIGGIIGRWLTDD